MPGEAASPCTTCGACCASLTVGFAESETTRRGGRVPWLLTEPWIPGHRRMCGTTQASPRCVALTGVVGRTTSCGVYLDRPTPCRDLMPGDEHCRRSRERWGLPPLPASP